MIGKTETEMDIDCKKTKRVTETDINRKNYHCPSSNYNHDRQWPVLVARTSQLHWI